MFDVRMKRTVKYHKIHLCSEHKCRVHLYIIYVLCSYYCNVRNIVYKTRVLCYLYFKRH